MALTDTFVKQVKPIKAGGDKYADGGGMYLLVNQARREAGQGNCGSTDVRGGCPRVAEENRRNACRRYPRKITRWLEKDVFPSIGSTPISAIRPRDVLGMLQKVEARGTVECAHRIKQLCGQVFRYAVAVQLAEQDVTADLKGALAALPKTHYPPTTDPKQAGALLRAIHGYHGYPYAVAALKLAPLVFVRPGAASGLLHRWGRISWRIRSTGKSSNRAFPRQTSRRQSLPQ